ncbi:MAG: hypothetical protein ACM31D_10230 [Bacteroidota bacterium]
MRRLMPELCLVSSLLTAPPALAQMAVIDAAALQQLALQVSQSAEQLTALQSQIQNQMQMLQALPTNSAPQVAQLAQRTQSLLAQVDRIQVQGTALQAQLNAAYPDSYARFDPQAMLAQVAAMEASNRLAVATAMDIQNQIAVNQPLVANQVQATVSASQAASGPTAVAMATNQLLAMQSAQLAELQSLLISAQRAQQQQFLQQQTEAAAMRAFNSVPTAIATPQTFQVGY